MQSPDATQPSLEKPLTLTQVRELPCLDSRILTKHFFMAGFLKSYNTTFLSTRSKHFFKATNETSNIFFPAKYLSCYCHKTKTASTFLCSWMKQICICVR